MKHYELKLKDNKKAMVDLLYETKHYIVHRSPESTKLSKKDRKYIISMKDVEYSGSFHDFHLLSFDHAKISEVKHMVETFFEDTKVKVGNSKEYLQEIKPFAMLLLNTWSREYFLNKYKKAMELKELQK